MKWFEGCLKNAVQSAINYKKVFVIFLFDNGEESKLSNEVFQFESISSILSSHKYLTFRIELGSEDATHFSQIYHYDEIPSLFFINAQNGIPFYVINGPLVQENLLKILIEMEKRDVQNMDDLYESSTSECNEKFLDDLSSHQLKRYNIEVPKLNGSTEEEKVKRVKDFTIKLSDCIKENDSPSVTLEKAENNEDEGFIETSVNSDISISSPELAENKDTYSESNSDDITSSGTPAIEPISIDSTPLLNIANDASNESVIPSQSTISDHSTPLVNNTDDASDEVVNPSQSTILDGSTPSVNNTDDASNKAVIPSQSTSLDGSTPSVNNADDASTEAVIPSQSTISDGSTPSVNNADVLSTEAAISSQSTISDDSTPSVNNADDTSPEVVILLHNTISDGSTPSVNNADHASTEAVIPSPSTISADSTLLVNKLDNASNETDVPSESSSSHEPVTIKEDTDYSLQEKNSVSSTSVIVQSSNVLRQRKNDKDSEKVHPTSTLKEETGKTSTSAFQRDRTKIKFRFLDGSSLISEFASSSPLSSLHSYLIGNNIPDGFTMISSITNKPFDPSEYNRTLSEIGLVPSAIVIVKIASSSIQKVNFNLFSLLMSVFAPFQFVYNYIGRFIWPQRNNNTKKSNTSQPIQAQKQTESNRATKDKSKFKRDGNIYRLRMGGEDKDDEDNNTWNGNSTEQM